MPSFLDPCAAPPRGKHLLFFPIELPAHRPSLHFRFTQPPLDPLNFRFTQLGVESLNFRFTQPPLDPLNFRFTQPPLDP